MSRAKVTIDDLRSHAPVTVASPPFLPDVEGCGGIRMSHLLGKATAGVGVIQGDTETEKINYAELAQGVLLYQRPDGSPLPLAQGGPLRAVFPAGVALEADEEGCDSPADVKDVRGIELTT